MARHFNGVYSVRAGYHGVRKSSFSPSNFWTCSQGHINPVSQLVDERESGGFAHNEAVTKCLRCGEDRKVAEAK